MTPPAVAAAPPLACSPALPAARGPLTAFLFERLRRPAHDPGHGPAWAPGAVAGDDFQLALYACYDLHYRSFAGVDDRWEWEPGLLAWRRRLEAAFEGWLAGLAGGGPTAAVDGAEAVEAQLWAMAGGGGPSLSAYVAEEAGIDQVRELAVHRSPYQLKEADPHTWALPRLAGGPKAAMVAIQMDEYGRGREADMHATLFAATMEELGLDAGYGAYLDLVPGVTLATVNLVSLFGLHRRLRGALVGHLALFEMTSVGPMGRYSRALARLGFGGRARRFYDVHVEADALHQLVAARDLAGALAAGEPGLAPTILFGARAVTALEGRFTDHVLGCWEAGRTSLRRPLAGAGAGGARAG